eukprot:5209971-Pyramimonas_sp.AAC.1
MQVPRKHSRQFRIADVPNKLARSCEFLRKLCALHGCLNMLPHGLRARMSKSLERPCARAVAITLCNKSDE